MHRDLQYAYRDYYQSSEGLGDRSLAALAYLLLDQMVSSASGRVSPSTPSSPKLSR